MNSKTLLKLGTLAAIIPLLLISTGCDVDDVVDHLSAVRGTVSDSNGKPIESVLVTVKGSAYSALTNGTGEYVINVPVGTLVLGASKQGFISVSKSVNVPRADEGAPVTLDFVLKKNGGSAGCNVLVELATDRSAYSAGTPVQMKLKVENRGDNIVTLGGDKPPYGFFATDSSGRVIWRYDAPQIDYSDAQVKPFITDTIVIAPGESRVFDTTWNWTPKMIGKICSRGMYVEMRGVVRPTGYTLIGNESYGGTESEDGNSTDSNGGDSDEDDTGDSDSDTGSTSTDLVSILPAPVPVNEIISKPVMIHLLPPPVITEELPFKTFIRGSDSAWKNRAALVIGNEDEWFKFWSSHSPAWNNVNTDCPTAVNRCIEPPRIDFSHNTVIAVMGGYKNCPYEVTIRKIVRKRPRAVPCLEDSIEECFPARTTVFIDEEPVLSASCDYGHSPFHIVITRKLSGKISFCWKKTAPRPRPLPPIETVDTDGTSFSCGQGD